MQIVNLFKQSNPIITKVYKRAGIIKSKPDGLGRFWITDLDGNFNLICANKRALRLLNRFQAINQLNKE